MVFCTKFVDEWWSWDPLVGRVYGANGAPQHHSHRFISKLFLLKTCNDGFVLINI